MQSAILRCSEQMYTETLELLLYSYIRQFAFAKQKEVLCRNAKRILDVLFKLPVSCLLIACPGPGPGPGPGPFRLLWEMETFLRGHAAVPRGSPSVSEVNDA